jgi:hypothetical protein
MADWFQDIVDRDASADEAGRLAAVIRDWLITDGIVQGNPNTGCVLGNTGYPPGPECWKAVVEPPDLSFLRLVTNGMAIITGRRVFHSGQGEFAVVCRGCGARSCGGERWEDAVREWHRGSGPGVVACPACGHAEPVAEWGYDPPWGLGALAFEFWNWSPLRESFVAEVTRRLGHRTVLVTGKL